MNKAFLIQLPKINDDRGCLSVVESQIHVPFNINRIYYLYDVPAGSERGGHGHRNLEQLIIALSGSFTVTLDDGLQKKIFFLDNPGYGLYVPSMMWRSLTDFTKGSVCMVLASNLYDEKDYFRDYESFLNAVNGS